MHFDHLRSALVRKLEHGAATRAFHEAQHRHSILTQYPTLVAALDDVVGLEGKFGRRDDATIDTFLRALLNEYRDHPHPVWASALTAAFLPSLTRLKLRVRSSAHDDDGKRDLVVDAWLEAIARVARVSDRDRLPMRLVQQMKRRAFSAVRKTCRERNVVRDIVTAAMETGAIEPFAQGRGALVPHVGELLVEIREATRDAHAGDDMELARRLDDASSLLERLRMLYPDAPNEDIEQMYERLKKRVSRAFARVRSTAEQAALEAAQTTRRQPALRRRRKAAK